MKYYLGIDGGGSKTTAVVFDENGFFVKKAIGESINYYSVGLETARKNINDIIVSLDFGNYESVFIGMSALNERANSETTNRFASGIISSQKITMDSDLFVALEAMATEGECAVIISGTGSMAIMRNADGLISHAGGWGYILGDEGSGYVIGLGGIKAAIRSVEGGKKTELLSACLKHFGIKDIYELIDLYYDKGVERKTTAAFAKSVLELSSTDQVSAEIIEAQATDLAETAKALIKNPECKTGLWGGVFQNSELFRQKFTEKSGFTKASLLPLTPEQGAILAAMKESGIKITEEIINNIKKSYNYENS